MKLTVNGRIGLLRDHLEHHRQIKKVPHGLRYSFVDHIRVCDIELILRFYGDYRNNPEYADYCDVLKLRYDVNPYNWRGMYTYAFEEETVDWIDRNTPVNGISITCPECGNREDL